MTTIILTIAASIISFVIEDNIKICCFDSNCLLGWLNHFWLAKIIGFAFLINFCVCAFNYSDLKNQICLNYLINSNN